MVSYDDLTCEYGSASVRLQQDMVRSIGNQITIGNHIIRGQKPMVTVPQENVVNLTATNSIDMKECWYQYI